MLKVESGRHTNTPINERKCEFCMNNDIWDEFHFVILCPLYNDLRKTSINNFYYTRPSVHNLTLLLNNANRKVLINLALYCKYALKLRLESMNSNN